MPHSAPLPARGFGVMSPTRALAFGLMGLLGVLPAAGQEPVESPGVLEMQPVVLEPPAAAIEAYLNDFATREWFIPLEGRNQFFALIRESKLAPGRSGQLLDPQYWRVAPDGNGFVITPPATLLEALAPLEREKLYRHLSQWPENKVERWPLVIRDTAMFSQLQEAGFDPDLIECVKSLCYPFRGGFAFSDIAVLIAKHPDRDQLRRFLRLVSTVETQLPRLKLDRVVSITKTLAYWTMENRNPFALPLLEALLESRSPRGVDLVAILPSAARVLSLSLDPEDVGHDHAAMSYVIAASLVTNTVDLDPNESVFSWFERHFSPLEGPPLNYGDVLVVEYPNVPGPDYACVHIYGDLVFARDPVGLGLWRFLSHEELLRRNPHFAPAALVAWRKRQ